LKVQIRMLDSWVVFFISILWFSLNGYCSKDNLINYGYKQNMKVKKFKASFELPTQSWFRNLVILFLYFQILATQKPKTTFIFHHLTNKSLRKNKLLHLSNLNFSKRITKIKIWMSKLQQNASSIFCLLPIFPPHDYFILGSSHATHIQALNIDV